MVDLDDPRMYVIFAPVLSPVSAKSEETTEKVRINGFDYDITYYPASQYEPSDLIATGRDLDGNEIDVPYKSLPVAIKSDRKSTRLNSSHVAISYAVFCL